jgi:hypothetical protein
MSPTKEALELAREIVKDWYEGWLKCPTWTTAFQEYGVQQIAAALDAAQAPKVSESDRDACLSYRIMKAALSTEDFDEAQEKVEALLAGRDQG